MQSEAIFFLIRGSDSESDGDQLISKSSRKSTKAPTPASKLPVMSPRGLGAKMKVRERSVVSLGCATRAKKAKLDTKVGRLLLKRNLNV